MRTNINVQELTVKALTTDQVAVLTTAQVSAVEAADVAVLKIGRAHV